MIPIARRTILAVSLSLLWTSGAAAQGLAIDKATCAPDPCQLSSQVTVVFKDLPSWLAAPVPADAPKHDASKLELALNGHLLKGLTPALPTAGSNILLFRLTLTSDNRQAWNDLLSGSKTNSLNVQLGVGMEGISTLLAETPVRFTIVPLNNGWTWGGIFVVVALLVLFMVLAHRSSILRDPARGLGPGEFGSYSLARTQIAWWLFIVIGSFVYIWMVTGDHETITQGVLVLIGISTAAGLGSVVIDSGKQDQRKTLEIQRNAVGVELSGLEQQIAVPGALADPLKAAALIQKFAQLKDIENKLHNLPMPPGASERFLSDILSDDQGVSLHRFQMAAWTVILGIVFIHEVWSKLALPDFNATLLGLMGISAGTYVAFKIPDAPK
jgi:hypothetical protein